MERVFDILVSCDKPAVIFIDDLDRCSPDIVVEVIEAINLIINGDYRNKCYFVIGMDAKMVAASLDKKYAALSEKFEEEKNRFGDIGYYFLDKFVQLPFVIPVIKDEDRNSLLDNLFTRKQDSKATEELRDEEKNIVVAYTRNSTAHPKAEEAERLIRENSQAKIIYIQNKVQEVSEDSEEIIKQLKEFSPYLGNSPRSIKRFINMFRFYYSYQELRRLEKKSYASPYILARWLVLSVRAPQLIRFLQSETEEKFVNSSDPIEKAVYFDKCLVDFRKSTDYKDSVTTNNKIIDKWTLYVNDLKIPNFDWLKEKQTIELLLKDGSEESKLSNALKCNVW